MDGFGRRGLEGGWSSSFGHGAGGGGTGMTTATTNSSFASHVTSSSTSMSSFRTSTQMTSSSFSITSDHGGSNSSSSSTSRSGSGAFSSSRPTVKEVSGGGATTTSRSSFSTTSADRSFSSLSSSNNKPTTTTTKTVDNTTTTAAAQKMASSSSSSPSSLLEPGRRFTGPSSLPGVFGPCDTASSPRSNVTRSGFAEPNTTRSCFAESEASSVAGRGFSSPKLSSTRSSSFRSTLSSTQSGSPSTKTDIKSSKSRQDKKNMTSKMSSNLKVEEKEASKTTRKSEEREAAKTSTSSKYGDKANSKTSSSSRQSEERENNSKTSLFSRKSEERECSKKTSTTNWSSRTDQRRGSRTSPARQTTPTTSISTSRASQTKKKERRASKDERKTSLDESKDDERKINGGGTERKSSERIKRASESKKISSERKVSVAAEDKTSNIREKMDEKTKKGGKLIQGKDITNTSSLNTDTSRRVDHNILSTQTRGKTDQHRVKKSTLISKESADQITLKGKATTETYQVQKSDNDTFHHHHQRGKESDRATQTKGKASQSPRVRHGKTTKVGDRSVTSLYFQLEDLSPVSLEKTFRTELNLPHPSDHPQDYPTSPIIIDDDDEYLAKSEARVTVTSGDQLGQHRQSASQLMVESDLLDGQTTTTTTTLAGSSLQVTTVTSKRRLASAAAASGAAQPLLTHPVTGEKMTLHQAMSEELVDLAKGLFIHPTTGEQMPLAEATERGYVSPVLNEHLNTPCGIIDPNTGRELTLLQATGVGLYSPQDASFKDPTTGQLLTPEEAAKKGYVILEKVSFFTQLCVPVVATLTLYDAIVEGLVNVRTGEFTVPSSGEKISLTQAFAKGFISVEQAPVSTSGVSLSDAISQGFIDPYSGQAVDRNSGNKYTLDEAVDKGLLASHIREVVNSDTGCKLTVAEAIEEGVLDATAGRYVNTVTGQKIQFTEAMQQHLICRPYTLKDCCDLKLLDNKGHIQDPQIGDYVPLLEAVGKGIVDVDLKSVKDTTSQTLLTLPEALMFSVLLPEGKYRDTESGEILSLIDAVNRGLITSVSTKTIFDIDGIKDPETGDYISFKMAMLKGVIDSQTGMFTDPRNGNTMTLEEAVSAKMIQPQILETLKMNIGICDNEGKEMNVVEAVLNGWLDPNTGQILDPKTGNAVALEEAVKRKIVTPEGAATLKGLLSVTVTTATITKTIKRYVTVKSSGVHMSESRVTLQEAKDKGLINEAQGTYHDPESGRVMPVDEAIQQGLVTLSTEWPAALPSDDVPTHRSPTRETTKRQHSPDKYPSPTKSARTSISEDHDPTSPHSPSKSPERMASPSKMSEPSSPSVSPERPQRRKGSQSEKAAPDTRSTSPDKTSKTPDRTSPTKTSRPSSPEKSSRRGSVEKLSASMKDHSSPSKEGKQLPPSNGEPMSDARPDNLFETVNGSRETSPIKSHPVSPSKSLASPDTSSRGGSPVKSGSSRPDSPMKSSGFGPESPLKTDESVPTSPDRGLPQSQTLSPERPPRKIKTSLKSPEDSVDSAMGIVDDADMTSSGASLTGSTGVLTESYMAKTRTLELPPDGWYLKEAIDEKLFDPVMGLFTIPGTDRLVSFEECVKIGIIDDQSAEVVDPKNGRLVSLTRAFDKSVLDCVGKYPDESNPDRRLTMKEAITKKLIVLKDRTEVIESVYGRVIQITSVDGQPDKVQVSGAGEGDVPGVFTEVRTNEPTVDRNPVEIKPGMTFDPTEGNIQLGDGSVIDVVTAVKEGKLQPTGVKVKDPYTGRDLNISEAMRKGIIDKESGEYKDKTGRKLSLTDAAKYGILGVAAVVGAPVIAGVAAAQAIKKGIKKIKKVDPKTGAEIIIEESVEIITDASPDDQQPQSVVGKHSHTTIKSTTVVETDVILQDPTTGEEMSPEEAFSRGLISPTELEEIRSSAHGKIQEVQQMSDTEVASLPEGSSNIPQVKDAEEMKSVAPQKSVLKLELQDSKPEGKDEEDESPQSIDRKHPGKVSPDTKQPKEKSGILSPTQSALPSDDTDMKDLSDRLDKKPAVFTPEEELDGQTTFPVKSKEASPQTTSPVKSREFSPQTSPVKGGSREESPRTASPVKTVSREESPRSSSPVKAGTREVSPQTSSPVKTPSRGESPEDSLTERKLSLGEKTRERVTTEPKFSVAIGRAKSLPSPGHEGKPVVLQKVRRKSMKPKQAASKGVVDEKTAALLEDPSTFRGPAGELLSLEEALRLKKVDGNSGAIVDIACGEPLTISEAVESGLLDVTTGSVLVPVGRSISIPEAVFQGLFDKESQRFIHPETGDILTLREAMLCDIIDPVSQVVEPATQQVISLDEAIRKGFVNPETGQVTTDHGPVSVLEAIDTDMYVSSAVARIDWLPPLGMTFPVALERGLVDADRKEIIHPLTNDRQPLKTAIDNDFIFAFPSPILPESVQITQALECNLINTESCTFVIPNTGKEMPVETAVESGILQIKPMTTIVSEMSSIGGETTFIETVTSYETIVTKSVRVVSGYVVISPSEVKNVNTGKIIPIEEAKKEGIVTEEDPENIPEKLTFREAVEQGCVDFASGTFEDPITHKVLPIDKAIQQGLLEPTEAAPSTEVISKINIMQAFSTIYHEKSGKFKDPQTGTLLTLDEAMDKGVIDPNSMVYDTKSGNALTTREAVEKGVLDVEAGDFIDPKSGTKVKVKDAVKMGLLAVIGAPVLAGMAVTEVIKGARSKMKRSPTPVKSTTTIITEIIEEEYIPARTAEEMLQRPSLRPEDQTTFPVIEVGQKMTLRMAIEGGYIDVDLCIVVVPSTGNRRPLRRAVIEGSITLVTVVEIRSRTEIWVIEEVTIITEIIRTLDPAVMSEKGQFDPESGSFIDPATSKPIPFEEALDKCALNPEQTLVKDPTTGQEIPLSEAVKEGLVNPTTGEVVDPQTGETVSFFEAAKKGIVKVEDKKEPKKEKPEPLLSVNEAITQGILKPETGMFTNPATGESMIIGEAIQSGLLDPDSIQIYDPRTEEVISLKEADEIGLVDLDSTTFTDPETGCEMDFTTALRKGVLVPKRKPLSLVAVVKKQLYDPKSGKITDSLMKQKVDVDEAVRRGVVDPFITLCKDTKADKFITLDDALVTDLVVSQNGKLKNTKKNSFMTLDTAVQQDLIVTRRPAVPLTEAVMTADIYEPESGLFYDACEGENITLESSISCRLVDVNPCKVKVNEEVYTVGAAIEKHILDGEAGKLMQPEEMPLDEAVRRGHLVTALGSLSLQQVLEEGMYDPESGLINVNGDRFTIKEAIQQNIIDPTCLSVKDPRTDEPLSLEEAIKKGLIDPTTGTFKDPVTGADIELTEALTKGVVIEGRTKFTLYQAVSKALYNPSTGRITSPHSSDEVTVSRAIRSGLVDPSTTLARDPDTEQLMSFKQAVGKELIDTRLGMMKFGRIKKLNFKDAFEQDYLIEAQMPMALRVVIMKELYSEESGKFLRPATGEWITLSEALAIQMIDPESTHVKDTLAGRLKKINLREAIESEIIDGEKALVKNHQTGTWHTLLEAYELTLIVDSRVAMSLQQALHRGLVDDEEGLVMDVNTGRKITIHEAMRRLVINPSLPCYWDPNTSSCLSLVQTCREGIIDRRQGKFNDPKSGCTLTLMDAMEYGMILDIDKPQSLYDAVTMGFYEPKSGRMIQPSTGRKLTLANACKQEIVDPDVSIIKHADIPRFMKLNFAVQEGFIDDTAGKYIVPSTREKLTLGEAIERHLILPSKRPLTIEDALKYALYAPETGKFTEPTVGDKLDLKQAITHGLIDGNTSVLVDPAVKAMKSIRSAIEDKDIDPSKGLVIDPQTKTAHNINIAFEKGLIVTVGKPISFMQAVKEGSIDFEKGSYTDPKTGKEYTLEEALLFELIDPDSAVIKDPSTGRYKTLKRAIQEGLIDLKKRALFDPQTGTLKTLCIMFDQGTIVFIREPLSFDEAIDKGYLNVETGMYTDRNSKEVLNLREACRLGLIDPQTVLIKNTRYRQLLQPVEASEVGALDAEKGKIYNTATSHLLSIADALEAGLIVTPRHSLALLEALSYNLYHSETGCLMNPHQKQHVTLKEAVTSGLIDSTTTMVKCPASGNIQSMSEAVQSGVLDDVGGVVVDTSSSARHSLPEAHRLGYLLTAQARQAMIEKYRLCDATIVDMVDKVSEIERRLAEQEPVSENTNGLRNQINTVKAIKDELNEMFRPLGTCLDTVRQVVNQGGEVLSREELDSLDQAATILKQRYDHSVVQADTTHRRLTTAMEEFSKYEKEIALFQTWLKQATRTLIEKERLCSDLNKIKSHEQGCRDFLGDVIAHQADLRFITMATQKFLDESSLYLRTVNNFRTTLPERYPLLTADPDSVVRDASDEVSAEFKDLLARANKLVDKATSVGNKQRDYTEAIEKAIRWLKDTEVKISRLLQEPVGADPKGVQDQLDKAKAINNDVVAQSRLFENCRATATSLLRALEGELNAMEKEAIERPPEELTERYMELADRLGLRCQELDTALVQCQGVQEGLDSLMSWLNNIDLQLKNASKPASLNRDRLDEQLREHRQLHSDIMSHQVSKA
ncbi:hypothetical protein Pcinc_022743 [Petrolisthes cinctipes]|uniref:Uncharacterized protein n=1 Tax=Petrolisthes cinctipes TaxID=88211 RepID=A0AAE1FE64_PETCI|nr:hypothetical protein Pcinc_022743 [Petrolisthes cinctipes]